MDKVNEVLVTLANQPVGYWWVLGALILILVVRRWIGSGRLAVLRNSTGRVQVSRGAIKGLILRTCHSIEGISHPSARIYTRGGKLRLRVYVQLRGAALLSEVTPLLQENLESTLRVNLGLDRIGRIDVIVTDIHPLRNKKQKSSSKTEVDASGKEHPKAPYPWGSAEAYAESEEIPSK